ncbi:MAG TPA: hypothetical protein VHP36_05845 [Chitinispirillaceae bacterium]|nr:hypothetical protein [Chitinispirillaceae bacterium]
MVCLRFFSLIFFSILSFASLVSAEVDSLTAPVCRNPNQIIAKLDGNKIEYWMGEYQLNISTTKGYLYNDGFSKPYLKKYNLFRGSSYAMLGGGLGLVIAGFSIGKSLISLGGLVSAGSGLVIYFKSNEKFRIAIHEYNKSICSSKFHP